VVRFVRLAAAAVLTFGVVVLPKAPATAAPACPAHPVNLTGKTVDPAKYGHDGLRCAKLANANLDGLDLVQFDLDQVNLSGASLRGAKLGQADLTGAALTGAHLDGADLVQTTMTGVQAGDASFRDAKLIQSHLENANLAGADLTGADFTQAYLNNADLRGAKVKGADFTQAETGGAKMDAAAKSTVTDSGFSTSVPGWLFAIPFVVVGVVILIVFIAITRAVRRSTRRIATAYPGRTQPVFAPTRFMPPAQRPAQAGTPDGDADRSTPVHRARRRPVVAAVDTTGVRRLRAADGQLTNGLDSRRVPRD